MKLVAALSWIAAFVGLAFSLLRPSELSPHSPFHSGVAIVGLLPFVLFYGWPAAYQRVRNLSWRGRLAVGLLLGLLVLGDLWVRARTSPYPRTDIRFYVDLGFVLLGNLVFAFLWVGVWAGKLFRDRGTTSGEV